jgi:hypothetical protein
VGNRTQASRERLNPTRIKHCAQPTLVILMAVYGYTHGGLSYTHGSSRPK